MYYTVSRGPIFYDLGSCHYLWQPGGGQISVAIGNVKSLIFCPFLYHTSLNNTFHPVRKPVSHHIPVKDIVMTNSIEN